MRIIGGIHRNRRLKRVNKVTTRETADMVREAVFNVLGGSISGNVLDLFAGSGAYGLEAISRGANNLYSNDINIDAYKTILANIQELKENDKVTVFHQDYKKLLEFLQKKAIIFNYIFIDPPYSFSEYEELISSLYNILDKNGIIIVETDIKTFLSFDIDLYVVNKEKTYGRKRVYFLEKA